MISVAEAVVVGGGIGGLAAAVALHRVGWRVTVLERAPEFTEIAPGWRSGPTPCAPSPRSGRPVRCVMSPESRPSAGCGTAPGGGSPVRTTPRWGDAARVAVGAGGVRGLGVGRVRCGFLPLCSWVRGAAACRAGRDGGSDVSGRGAEKAGHASVGTP
ncbi:MAG TPA: NAD(P)-binding protein [Nonomuraea sp.]|nr:NAD(P)-binding protein [Nonomuraea sp.]